MKAFCQRERESIGEHPNLSFSIKKYPVHTITHKDGLHNCDNAAPKENCVNNKKTHIEQEQCNELKNTIQECVGGIFPLQDFQTSCPLDHI